MLDSYDFELELDSSLENRFPFEDESEIPEAPESWSLDDFGDLVNGSDEFML
jgi:hypothetical protein